MTNDLEAQTRAAMDGIKQTLEAAGASLKDVVLGEPEQLIEIPMFAVVD
jgi:enamine deaminase RidA (YjgF/YER057c/UK114 family)